MKGLFGGKKLRILAATMAATVLMAALAVGALSEVPSGGVQRLSELERGAFPAAGNATQDVTTWDAPGGASVGRVKEAAVLVVTDYVLAQGQPYFIVSVDGADAYVEDGALDITFAMPVVGEALATVQMYLQKPAADTLGDDTQSITLYKGQFVRVSGREGDWWVLEVDGTPLYAQANGISAIPTIAARFDAAGEYGTDTVETIKGSVVISADGVTLKNMVIEGNLYLLEGVKTLALRDAYIANSTFMREQSVKVDSRMDKIKENMGSPSAIVSELYRDNYAAQDGAVLAQDLAQLFTDINSTVYAD